MSGDQQSLLRDATDDRPAFDQQVGTQCMAISASIVVILVALALVALL
ncbi:hypothetical protein [Gordonia phthalatica]|nr:hypothetical protein [Gordonia phthalatica]